MSRGGWDRAGQDRMYYATHRCDTTFYYAVAFCTT